MTWRDIERLIKHSSFILIVEPRRTKNRYWISQGHTYFEITSLQFDRLLEGGYIDPDYRRENSGQWSGEALVYEGR